MILDRYLSVLHEVVNEEGDSKKTGWTQNSRVLFRIEVAPVI
jgi:hypothetical protein